MLKDDLLHIFILYEHCLGLKKGISIVATRNHILPFILSLECTRIKPRISLIDVGNGQFDKLGIVVYTIFFSCCIACSWFYPLYIMTWHMVFFYTRRTSKVKGMWLRNLNPCLDRAVFWATSLTRGLSVFNLLGCQVTHIDAGLELVNAGFLKAGESCCTALAGLDIFWGALLSRYGIAETLCLLGRIAGDGRLQLYWCWSKTGHLLIFWFCDALFLTLVYIGDSSVWWDATGWPFGRDRTVMHCGLLLKYTRPFHNRSVGGLWETFGADAQTVTCWWAGRIKFCGKRYIDTACPPSSCHRM